jgi:hypothetical protein
MTSSTASINGKPAGKAAGNGAGNGTAAAASRKPRLDPRYIAPLLITCILLVANLTEGVLESP